jgi:hypothetical protein
VKGVEVRKPDQLQGLDSLIIPGGESTTMAKLANYHNLVGPFLSSVFLNFLSVVPYQVIPKSVGRPTEFSLLSICHGISSTPKLVGATLSLERHRPELE